MKYFLFLLLSVTTFCAHSQDDVILPLPVAKWYLERAMVADLLEDRVELKDQLIKNFEEKLHIQQQVIATYREDSVYYNLMMQAHEEWFDAKERQIISLRKSLKKSLVKSDILIGAGAGAVAGSVLGQPLPGAVVGGVVGLVRGLTRKK